MRDYAYLWMTCRNIELYLERHSKKVDRVTSWCAGFGHDGTKKNLPVRARTYTNNVLEWVCVPHVALMSEEEPKWWVDPQNITKWQEVMLGKLKEHYSPLTVDITDNYNLVIDGDILRTIEFYTTVNYTDYDYWLKYYVRLIDEARGKIN